ncbi:MAG: hypothetical protein HWE14_10290 [Flavobacteriia bacterium]|nr:hypothetical protein [Flavobacteriia bacterium]
MKARVSFAILAIPLAFLFSNCTEEERMSVPWWITGTEYTFTPTSGGSVSWFSYEVTDNGVIACNSTGQTWETFEGYDGSNSLAVVEVTVYYPDNAWEKFTIKDDGTYNYTGRTASGYTESHSGEWSEGGRC